MEFNIKIALRFMGITADKIIWKTEKFVDLNYRLKHPLRKKIKKSEGSDSYGRDYPA
jgi:hypothetical protein